MDKIGLAKRMIRAKASNRENIFNFQFWKVENLKSVRWSKDSMREIYNKAQLKENDYRAFIMEYKKIFLSF